jgi:transcription elongation factor SPT6
VPQVAVTFNDPQGTPTAPKNPDKLPTDVAEEYAGPSTPFLTGEDALKGQ